MIRSNRFLVVIVPMLALLFAGACTSSRKPPESSPPQPSEPGLFNLELGDENRKSELTAVSLDEIVDTHSGVSLTFEALVDKLAETDVVYLGESHTSYAIHQWQDRIIRALHARGTQLKIAMEFFERSDNPVLERWVDGWLTEKGLIYKTGWYADGGYNFGYYRPFITFAAQMDIPVFGMNIPRSVLRVISRQGVDALTDEQAAMVGVLDLDDDQHRELIMFYFGGAAMAHGGEDEEAEQQRLDRMYAAQSAWDSVFADSVIAAHEDWDGTIVVIVGSGHVAYDLGTNRLLRARSDLSELTVMPVTTEPGSKTWARRSYGDILIGVVSDTDPEHYPNFGVRATDHAGAIVVGMLFPGALATDAGMQRGDVITALDGVALKDVTDMRIRLSRKAWGETATFTVLRGDETLEIEITPEKQ